MKIIFFGTPPFAASVLEFLLGKPVNVVAIVTKHDKPQGRSQLLKPPAVKALAQTLCPNIPLYQPLKASHEEFAEILKTYKADLFVVVAYSEIIKSNLLQMPKFGCVNIHASLLPKYRGAAPIQRALINGETKSGVTIIQMVKELDAGDMLATREVAIDEEMNAKQLAEILCEKGKEALWEVINSLKTGELKSISQDHSIATFAPKITVEGCQIDWSKSALEIHNLVRGVFPKPGAWTTIELKGEKKRLTIRKTRIYEKERVLASPAALLSQKEFVIACGVGALEILELQLEGKKALSIQEFERGISRNLFKLIN